MNLKNFIFTWGLVFLSALFDSYAACIVKMKFNQLGAIDLRSWNGFLQYMGVFVKSPVLLTALATFLAAPALWFLALNRLDLSVAYPVLVGFHVFFVVVFGVAFLGEGLTVYKTIGIGLVLLSVFLVNR